MTNKLDRWIKEKIQGSASPKKVKVAERKKKSSKKPTHGGSNKRGTKQKNNIRKNKHMRISKVIRIIKNRTKNIARALLTIANLLTKVLRVKNGEPEGRQKFV